MIFDLRPHHAARALTMLFLIPVLWTFGVEGVTTTTEYDFSTGEVSSSSDLGSQLASSVIWIILAAAAGAASWYLERNRIDWPDSFKEHLRKAKLAPPANPGR